MRLLALLTALALSAAPARAAFEDQGAGARGPGMGNAFTAVADDVFTLHYNPGGLGTLERPQLGTSYAALYPGLSDSSSLSSSFLGYVHPIKEAKYGTVGLGWNSFALNGGLYREDAVTMGYGRKAASLFRGELFLGVNAKYLRTSIGNFTAGTNAVPTGGVVGTGQNDPLLASGKSRGAMSADLGLLHKFARSYAFGAAITDVNQPDVSLSKSGQAKVPMGVKAGMTYGSLISNAVLEVANRRAPTGGRDTYFTAAAERWFAKLFVGEFGLRGGLTLGSRDYKNASLGLSYRTRRLEADYAMGIPIGGVATTFGSHRVGLSFRFGRATDEEESLEMVLDAMKQLKAGQAVTLPTSKRSSLGKAEKATLSEYLAQARGHESRAKYRDALEKMRSALMIAPADADVLNHFQRLTFVSQMIAELPDYKNDPAQASLHLGNLAYISGNELEAVKKVSEALSLKPEHRALDAYLTQMELVTGIKRTTFSTAHKPDYKAAVNLTRANAALEEGDYEKAIELSLAVIRVDPNSAAAWENLGTAYFAQKDYDSSLKAWKRAYELEKSPALRQAIKGYMKTIGRAQDKAASAPKKAVSVPLPDRPKLDPAERQEMFNQAIDHYTRREFPEAKELLEKLLQADPEDVEAQKALKRVKDELP